jgi:hypothetical protein
MGWSATRNPNGTLHVVNDVDGSHFTAQDEDEVHEVIDSVNQRVQEKDAAEQAVSTADPNALRTPEQTLRVN